MIDWLDDAPTRIASVDPVTGEIRTSVTAIPTEETSQETQIFAPRKGQDAPEYENAAFCPPGESAHPEEATAMWQPEARRILQRPLSVLCAKMPGRSGRFRFVIIAGAACVLVAGAGVLASSIGDPVDVMPPPPRSEAFLPTGGPSSVPPMDVQTAPPPKPPRTPLRPIVDGAVQRPRLVHAAEALTLGQYDKARDIYRELSAWEPADSASSLALRILENQQRENTP